MTTKAKLSIPALLLLLALAFLCLGSIRIVPPWLIGKVTHDAQPRWIFIGGTSGVSLPMTSVETNLAPWVDGFLVVFDSANGTVTTDTTTCTTAPCTQTSSFATLDTDVKAYAALTCAASLRGNSGHPCYIAFTLRSVGNSTSYNQDTPTWVASAAWQQTVGAASPQDFGFCSGYPQNGSANPLAPATGTANISSTNCGSGSTQCTAATVATGVPAFWETPYLNYRENAAGQFLTYLKTASYLSQVKYVGVNIGIGGENSSLCLTISGAAGTGLESLVTPATDAELKIQYLGAVAANFSYLNSLRQSLGLTSAITLVGRFNYPGGQLTSGFSSDPSWALAEASYATLYPNTGIGSDGWRNYSNAGGVGSDLVNIVGASVSCVSPANSPTCTSNNWSNVNHAYSKGVALNIAQMCNKSNPAGGTANCLDASQSGTGAQADTLWQILTLAGANGVNVIELTELDAECYADYNPTSPCTSGSAIQLAYTGAAKAWANGQIPINQ